MAARDERSCLAVIFSLVPLHFPVLAGRVVFPRATAEIANRRQSRGSTENPTRSICEDLQREMIVDTGLIIRRCVGIR